MAIQKLSVGAVVRFSRVKTKTAEAREYRVEQLVTVEDGLTLYRIKSVAEPFCRVVSETDLDTRI